MRATSASSTTARPAGLSPSAPALPLPAALLVPLAAAAAAVLLLALPPFLAGDAVAAELRRCSERSLRMISARFALRSCSALSVSPASSAASISAFYICMCMIPRQHRVHTNSQSRPCAVAKMMCLHAPRFTESHTTTTHTHAANTTPKNAHAESRCIHTRTRTPTVTTTP